MFAGLIRSWKISRAIARLKTTRDVPAERVPEIARSAVGTLEAIGGPDVVRALAEFPLASYPTFVIGTVLDALGRLGDPAAIPVATTFLVVPLDWFKEVREAAARALKALGWKPGTPEERRAFAIATRDFAALDPHDPQTHSALRTLWDRLSGGEPGYAGPWYDADRGAVRAALDALTAGKAVAGLGEVEPLSLVAVVEMNLKANRRAALTGALALARIGDARAAAPLLDLLTEEPQKVADALEQLLRFAAAKVPAAILARLAELPDSEEVVYGELKSRRQTYDGVFEDVEGGYRESRAVPVSRATLRALAKKELARRG